jgi:uncharacterized ferritin-like protein (DUF455 family)
MSGEVPVAQIEQLFELAVQSKLLLIGREALRKNKSRLHFVLIATDIIANYREEVLADFKHYLVVQHYTAADFERLFQIKGAKTVGFAKSDLAKSIYAGLKSYRINEPLHPSKKSSGSPPMELREFAERVLFATTLEEKLLRPADITDEKPGAAFVIPAAPGRPNGLQFKATAEARDSFPGTKNLEQESERGKLLHFFANHELLATELMALVLLKFPDAPAAFRKGVLQTLKDEQEHTQLYLDRMKACGIHFGELPVSGYFWRSVSVMENPMDYVSSLCLTFEQANLDFARHYAKGFASIGDNETSQLLEKIYRDEIGHVAHGLKWFRRWKNPSESDWEAFCRQLKFPLSPQRAKGITLNVAGRRAAGLDAEFIAELDVFSQSKGRTPNVFVFNPFAEARIAHGKSFNPTKHQAQLARDLANLPQFLCRQDDIVLVDEKPSVEFLSGIKQAGFALPEFVELPERGSVTRSSFVLAESVKIIQCFFHDGLAAGHRPALQSSLANLTERKLGRLRPWAWGPDSVELFEPIFGNLTGEKRTTSGSFNPGIAQLYSKAWSAALLKKIIRRSRGDEPQIKSPKSSQRLLTSSPTEHWLCTENEVGVAVNSIDAALDAVATIRQRGHHKIVIKESLGLAGSHAMRLFEPEILETHRRWIANTVTNGRQLVVEPWLERELDFSVQLEMSDEGLKLCGYTGLINDARGQFQANVALPGHQKKIPTNLITLFPEPPDIAQRLHALFAEIFSLLEDELRRAKFLGPIGIDAFAYRDADGKIRLKPIVEINPRYTMGRVTVELMKQVAPGSRGLFRLVNRRQALAEGFENFASYALLLAEKFPIQLRGEPSSRIGEGAICLNDPAQAQVCLAVFQVAHAAGDFSLADLTASSSSQRA